MALVIRSGVSAPIIFSPMLELVAISARSFWTTSRDAFSGILFAGSNEANRVSTSSTVGGLFETFDNSIPTLDVLVSNTFQLLEAWLGSRVRSK